MSSFDKRLTEIQELTAPSLDDVMYVVHDGVSYQTDVDLLFPTFIGNEDINSVGTILSGVWNATPISGEYIGNHSTTHYKDSSDEISIDELDEPEDNTNLNSSIEYHGLTPKLNGYFNYNLAGNGMYIPRINNQISDETIKMTSIKSSGNISGEVRSSTGYIAIQWWDNTVSIVGSGSSTTNYIWSKAVPSYPSDYSGGSIKKIYIWPCASSTDLTKNGTITRIYNDENNLCSIDYGNMSLMTHVYCGYNDLKNINLNNTPSITNIDCSYNNIKILYLSNHPSLAYIKADHNTPMTEARLDNISDLEYLYLNDCSLSKMSLSNCQYLISVDIQRNNLSADALDDFFITLSDGGSAEIYISGNPGTSTCDESIATDKGYTIYS